MMRIRKEKDFVSCFDNRTGAYLRTGILKDGYETEEEPFMASFPELIDIGIMGHCTYGQSGLCLQSGIQCYQNGLNRDDANMCIQDFQRIISECRENTYQVALGGCGDPDQHEDFEEILKICIDAEIVPNFTTSGLGMTKEIAMICKKYCGAVAVSWYRSPYTLNAISLLLEAGVKTNIHYVLMKDTIKEAIDLLEGNKFLQGINAVVFLLHKPVGLGSDEQIIRKDNSELKKFLECVERKHFPFKIGFDSCTVPALVGNTAFVSSYMDTCEGGRWSAYISADMKMMPCSFDNQELRWSVDLRNCTIQDAWFSKEFDDFREHLKYACPECVHRSDCMGGCPICPDIVLCYTQDKRVVKKK